MPKIIVLDTGTLSNCVVKIGSNSNAAPTTSELCRQWLTDCEHHGAMVIVPAIAYYEALREIELRQATGQRTRLIQYCFQPGRFIPLTTTQLETAAMLWAQSRRAGTPTSGDAALDGDVILCAQVQSLQLLPEDYVVATTNVKHLNQFVNAAEWQTITP